MGCDGLATCTSTITHRTLRGATKNVTQWKIVANLLLYVFDVHEHVLTLLTTTILAGRMYNFN